MRVTGTAIHEIQGRDHDSPFEGRRVSGVTGVVTAIVDRGGEHVFWIQDPIGDDDSATSEGLKVLADKILPRVSVGDQVSVAGEVDERRRGGGLPMTLLVASRIEVIARDRDLPEPVLLGRGGRPIPNRQVDDDRLEVFEPTDDAIDFFEALESMRVRIVDPAVVGPTSRYGEIAVMADRGAGVSPRTVHGGVAVRPGTPHAARILIDDRIIGQPAMLRVGDRLSGGVVGVLDYSYGNFKLINSKALPEAVLGSTAPEMTDLRPERSKLTVATFNVENLNVGSDSGKFAGLGWVIARQMRSPDIVALQEVQDDSGPEDDGTVESAATVAALIRAVVERGGPRYAWRQIDPMDGGDGGQPGANIRAVFLYNPRRVEFVDRGDAGPRTTIRIGRGSSISHSPGRIAPGHPAFAGDGTDRYEPGRKPLVGEFFFDGRRVIMVNLHLKSKGGDDAMFGRRQPPRRPSEIQRAEQVRLVVEFVDRVLARDPQAAVVVLGDLNDFEFRGPIRELAAGVLENLMERLPVEDRYTYVYHGKSQTLDHILVSPRLASRAEIDAVHVNADFPVAERCSDHDPVVARFTMENSLEIQD